jgi:hypothetical protein
VVDDEQLQALADRLADEVLATQPRSNALTRYGKDRCGALATAADVVGTAIATGGIIRRAISLPDSLATERLYAQTVAVDRDRAHVDVYYVGQRLRLLALATADFLDVATDDDPDELVRGAAQALVAFVAAGRPPGQRLDEVEHAYTPLREATDGQQPTETVVGLLAAYLDAWLRALT